MAADISEWLEQLREEEVDFLELGSEELRRRMQEEFERAERYSDPLACLRVEVDASAESGRVAEQVTSLRSLSGGVERISSGTQQSAASSEGAMRMAGIVAVWRTYARGPTRLAYSQPAGNRWRRADRKRFRGACPPPGCLSLPGCRGSR